MHAIQAAACHECMSWFQYLGATASYQQKQTNGGNKEIHYLAEFELHQKWANEEQAWIGNMIDLLTDHRSLHQWLYIRLIFCHSQVEFNSISALQCHSTARAATDVGIYGLLASKSIMLPFHPCSLLVYIVDHAVAYFFISTSF